jgi:hypothetical protein
MSFTIGRMMRQLLGEAQRPDAKSLELKIGQVVKGVVLKLLAEQDALVSIDGVRLRARLEAPLTPGQATYLQVQAETGGGQIVLRPLPGKSPELTESALAEIIKGLGFKDQPPYRELAVRLQKQEVPLTRDNLLLFRGIMEQSPAGIPAEEWLDAAVTAYRKQLPVTTETVGALRQLLYGPPMAGLLAGLDREAADLLQSRSLSRGEEDASLRGLLVRLQETIRSVRNLGLAVKEQSDPGRIPFSRVQADLDGGEAPIRAPGGRAEATVFSQEPGPGSPAQAAPADAGDAHALPRRPLDASTEERQAGLLRQAANALESAPDSPRMSARAVEADVAPDPAERAQARHMQMLNVSARNEDTGVDAAAQEANRQLQGSKLVRGEPWMVRLFRAAGLDFEHRLSKLPETSAGGLASVAEQPVPERPAGPVQPISVGIEALLPDGRPFPATESLKSVLLQLAASDAAPAPLKEQAQQLLQHLTGQQLMLLPDRAEGLTHISMFLPVFDAGGRESAQVHIQARRGSKGEIDASNCRLLFDLEMETIGATLIDVHIFDRKVYLQLLCSDAAIGELIEAYREELAEGLKASGYMLEGIQCKPFPAAGEAGKSGRPAEASSLFNAYKPKSYKGVDYRV